MTESFKSLQQRTHSEGDILKLEQYGYKIHNTPIGKNQKTLSQSCRSMSTSVTCNGDGQKTDATKCDTQAKHRKPYGKAVRTFMSRFIRSGSVKNVKKGKGDGLVKGGLAPNVRRSEYDTEGMSDEVISNVDSDHHKSSTTAASRPLMTNPGLQVALPTWDVTPGTSGIYNHGNTCFLNAILQCLSNTDVFSDYFVNKKFKQIFNVKGIAKRLVGNARGEVTEHLADLLESLWSGQYSPEISGQFKSTVSKYNIQYKGSSQHDAQEFLLWLLDRINEELHHSPKKKAKETIKLKKGKESEVLKESSPEMVLSLASGFEVYNRFQALYQSSLTCPNCGRQSNTYESYLCLSLPVPQRSKRPVYITVVYLDDNPKQLKIALELNVADTVKDLRRKLAYELDVLPIRLILCQMFEDGFRNTYGDSQLLSDIHENETVFAFETFPISEVSKPPSSYELIQILLVHIERISATKCYRFCSPQVIHIPRDIDYQRLQAYIVKSMGLAVSEEAVARASKCAAMFRVLVLDSGARDCYLPTDVEMPLYTEPVDRALSTYHEEFGPAHVKFVIEWDAQNKDRTVDNDEDIVEEHLSVHKLRLNQQHPAHVSLDDCLNMFTKEERLGSEDAWHCPYCRESQGTIKKLGLWSVPDILVIHLKRFRQSGLKRNKLNVLVDFPVNGLEMGPHLQTPTVADPGPSGTTGQTISASYDSYDLYAVANHYGNMNGGHYTAFCKNPVDGRWYEFDDMNVKPLSQRDIVSRSAYLLFYQRKQLINNTTNALHSGTHWVFNLHGPLSKTRAKTESVDDDDMEKIDSELRHLRARNQHDHTLKHEHFSNSHEADNRVHSNKPPSPDALSREINSPRYENQHGNYGINSPRSENISAPSRRESPQKDGYRNLNLQGTSAPSESHYRQTWTTRENEIGSHNQNSIRTSMPLPSGVEQNSLCPLPKANEVSHVRPGYRRSDSVDSSKNSASCTSSSDASGGSSPPSPPDNSSHHLNKTGPLSVPDRVSSVSKTGETVVPNSVLNNKRAMNSQPVKASMDLKLNIHSNEIQKDSGHVKSAKGESRQFYRTADKTLKTSNQKTNNTSQSTVNSDFRTNQQTNFSTPQQTRKSPSPPIQNGRMPWLTPQPSRKLYQGTSSDGRPGMDRQFSAPSRTQPQSHHSTDTSQLAVNGRTFGQPKSLPLEVSSDRASKPPLPKSGQTLSRQSAPVSRQASQDSYSSKPGEGYDRPHVQQYGETRPQTVGEVLERRAEDKGRDYLTETYYRAETGRDRPDHRNSDSYRSMRNRSERPSSYHQSNDLPDHQYYSEQPRYERDHTRYATIGRVARTNPHIDLYSPPDMIGPTHLNNHYNQSDHHRMHEPRSRAPLQYDPYRYQERGPTVDLPRYQPHLQVAKMLSKLVMQDNQLLQQQRMKSQCLKESSV